MSASLVGSEMCIRDRGRPKSPSLCQSALPHRTAPLRVAALRGLGRASVAVSYTHLTLPTICSV
eukprot:3758471-Alexandrium_andersonii.AAC.1